MSAAIVEDNCLSQCVLTSVETAQATSDFVDYAVRHYDGRVRQMARRFRSVVQADDLEQIGRLALFARAATWSASSPDAFWSCAAKCVFGAMMRHIRREGRRAAREAESFCAPQPAAPPDAVLEAKEHTALLTDAERELLFAHVSGVDLRTLAAEAGVSPNTIHYTLKGVLRKIQMKA